MAFKGNEADVITQTLEFINFVPFADLKKFKSGMPKSLNDIYKCNDPTITNDVLIEIGEKINYRVLNFLYSGVWNLSDVDLEKKLTTDALKAFGIAVLKDETENKIKNIENTEVNGEIIKTITTEINVEILNKKEEELEGIVKELINNLSKNWWKVFQVHEKYIEKIKTKKDLVSKIIVYEAPPYPKKNKLNYLLLDEAEGPYVKAITNSSLSVDYRNERNLQNILLDNSILFFDLLMMPIPIDSKLRRKWSTCDSFKINDKQLPVVLLELNLKHFKVKLNNKLNLTPTFALGMPHLTALSIYNYISGNKNKELSEIGIESLTKLNTAKVKKTIPNKVVPLFKSCFVNISNNPDAELLNNAFAAVGCNFFRKFFKKKFL
jgi:hypothetical protein